jgi:hypothetical protein
MVLRGNGVVRDQDVTKNDFHNFNGLTTPG